MPTYSFKCEKCGVVKDVFRFRIDDRYDPVPCPFCPGKKMQRAIGEESVNSTDHEYAKPVLSESLGVAPDQIKDAQRRFPHHEFAPDGRMVIRSHNQYQKIRKELGFHDRKGYH